MSPRSFASTLALGIVLAAPLVATSSVGAQDSRAYESSPERVGLEFRIGTYRPEIGDSFRDFYGSDKGPLIGGEIDVWAYRIPYVGPIGIGLGFGWARYTGRACARMGDTCVPTDERTRFTLFPLSALLVLRIDVLAREVHVPLVISPKIGLGYTRFRSESGGSTDGRGGSFGLHWGVQFALELDGFEPRAARALDDQWGINHSYVFFELYGSQANSGLNVGSDLAWVAGLGLQL